MAVARTRGVSTHEAVEDAVANLGRDAGTVVRDAQRHHGRGRGPLVGFHSLRGAGQGDGHAGTRGRVHAGVREEVREDLAQGSLVAEDGDVRCLAELPRVVGGDHVGV